MVRKPTSLGELTPDPKNARRHTDRNRQVIQESIERSGFGRSVLLAQDGTIIAGNATVEAAAAAGLSTVRVIDTDGREVIALRRTDVAPESEEFSRLALADNRSAELAEWDAGVLSGLAATMDLSGLWQPDELAALFGSQDELNRYAETIETPLYEPTGDCPAVTELADTTRRDGLLAEIARAELPEDVRTFLEVAAQRHVVFDYRHIAEFYAQAPASTQRLMEDSALVIIDAKRAIELGYVRLRNRLLEMMSGGDGE